MARGETRSGWVAVLGALMISLGLALSAERAAAQEFCWYCDVDGTVVDWGCYASNYSMDPGSNWCEEDWEQGDWGGCLEWGAGQCQPCTHCGPWGWLPSMQLDPSITFVVAQLVGWEADREGECPAPAPSEALDSSVPTDRADLVGEIPIRLATHGSWAEPLGPGSR
jgi:hypothetical protein